MKRLALALSVLGFALGAASLATSFPLSISHQLALGHTLAYALVRYFSFLTIIANIWLLLTYLAVLTDAQRLAFFRKASVQSSALATIILVMLFQHFILNPTREPLVGIDIYTDLINHYLAPAIYLVWWLVTLPRRELKWRYFLPVMLPAVLYPAYVLARGLLVNQYPYKVLDISAHGLPFVLAYMGQVVIGFAILCTLVLSANTLAITVTNRRNKQPR